MTIHLADEAATARVGARLAGALPGLELPAAGLHLHLHGPLGAGKTTLARGLLRALGVTGAVKSPTYTLVEPYASGNLEIFHFDCYRLGDPEELELLGARDYFHSNAVCVIEWPERAEGFLPAASLVLRLALDGTGRRLDVESRDLPGARLAEALERTHS